MAFDLKVECELSALYRIDRSRWPSWFSICPIFCLIAVICKHNLTKIPHSHILNLPSVVTLLVEEKKKRGRGASKKKNKKTHVFISQFAVHHDARPSVPARWLNPMPICCRVMRKQTRAAFCMSDLKHKQNLTHPRDDLDPARGSKRETPHLRAVARTPGCRFRCLRRWSDWIFFLFLSRDARRWAPFVLAD